MSCAALDLEVSVFSEPASEEEVVGGGEGAGKGKELDEGERRSKWNVQTRWPRSS